jgi:hypothetical protein
MSFVLRMVAHTVSRFLTEESTQEFPVVVDVTD